MTLPPEDDSVNNEPHRRGGRQPADPSEQRARRILESEQFNTKEAYRPGASIYDEPDILPGRVGEVVEQDWSCRNCGYNLRGIKLEQGCPECGVREWYRPPPRTDQRFANWLRTHQRATTTRTSWLVAGGAAVLGGPLAVIAALLYRPPGLPGASVPFLAIVFGPLMEEVMKVAAASLVVEVKPYLFKRVEQIQLATVGAAAIFAAVENVLYLNVYIPNPSVGDYLWRWTVCVAMHTGCTLIATRGIVAVWTQCVEQRRKPRIGQAASYIVTAAIVHGAYNAGVMGYEWLF
jgi:hypothetical protein